MLGAVVGLDMIFVLIALGGLVVTVWAIADAVSRPSAAFSAARSSKALWITLIVLFYLLTGIVGTVLAIVYLAAIRPRVKAVTGGS